MKRKQHRIGRCEKLGKWAVLRLLEREAKGRKGYIKRAGKTLRPRRRVILGAKERWTKGVFNQKDVKKKKKISKAGHRGGTAGGRGAFGGTLIES